MFSVGDILVLKIKKQHGWHPRIRMQTSSENQLHATKETTKEKKIKNKRKKKKKAKKHERDQTNNGKLNENPSFLTI